MRRAFALLLLACLLASPLSASAASDSGYFDDIYIELSQSYLRPDVDDNVTITIGLLEHGVKKAVPGVIISFKILSNASLVKLDEGIIMTDANGTASTTLRLNMDNVRARVPSLPAAVQLAAFTTYEAVSKDVFIVDTGMLTGYVVDDNKNTILNAKLTVYTPDGREALFLGGHYLSSNGTDSPMGWYSIEHMPIGMGPYKIIAEKGGFVGMNMIEVTDEDRRIDLIIPGYVDTGIKPTPVINNTTITPTPASTSIEPSARPGTMTSTIILVIVIVTLIYVGLKIYRRYF